MRRRWLFGMLLGVVWLGALGCAQTRYIANPGAAPSETGLRAANEDLELRVGGIIVPDGPGSWVKSAQWEEWHLVFTPSTDVTIEQVSLVDVRGACVEMESASLQRLAQASDAYAKMAKEMGIRVGYPMIMSPLISALALVPGVNLIGTAIGLAPYAAS